MNIKKLAVVSLISAGSLLGMSSSANATCSFSGKVERIWQNAAGAYIYMVPQTAINSSFYRYFWISDADLLRAAHASKDGNSLVNVVGNAATCLSGTGAKYGGVVSKVIRY